MTKQIIGAQGEITIIKLAAAPAGWSEMKAAERAPKGGWIISHSESGHHHVLTRGDVREAPERALGLKTIYALLDDPGELVQDAPTPHEGYALPAGFYEFRLAREFDPFAEQARRVAD